MFRGDGDLHLQVWVVHTYWTSHFTLQKHLTIVCHNFFVENNTLLIANDKLLVTTNFVGKNVKSCWIIFKKIKQFCRVLINRLYVLSSEWGEEGGSEVEKFVNYSFGVVNHKSWGHMTVLYTLWHACDPENVAESSY